MSTQHDTDSRELRSLCAERDEARRERDALRASVASLTTALAECRDVFPVPDSGAELESIWGQAMGDPESVPGYVRAQVEALTAEKAGLEASIGHLSRLLDEQRALLVDVEKDCGTDYYYGLPYEDGESEIIDRVRAHLSMLAATPQPEQQKGGAQ